MQRRTWLSLVVAVAAWFGATEALAQPSLVTTIVSGPDLPTPIALAEQDEVQLLDPLPSESDAGPVDPRVGTIERLAEPPAAFDPLYTVTSRLWPDIAASVGLVNVKPVALYDPVLAVARVESAGGPAWLRLGPLRASILDRYIVLGSTDALGPAPTILEVLYAARRNRMGPAIFVDGHEIGPGRWDARLLWAEIAEAEAIDARPFHFASHPAFPSILEAADVGDAKPVVFGIRDSALAGMRLDPASTPAPGDTQFVFRLRDGQEIVFRYIAATGMLVDLSPLERDPSAEFASVAAFEMTSEFRTLVNRLVATGGVAIEQSGMRLGDVFETTGGPWPPPGWQPAPGASGLRSPTPSPESWLNHRVAAGVRSLDREALRFAVLTGAAVLVVALAGILRQRR